MCLIVRSGCELIHKLAIKPSLSNSFYGYDILPAGKSAHHYFGCFIHIQLPLICIIRSIYLFESNQSILSPLLHRDVMLPQHIHIKCAHSYSSS